MSRHARVARCLALLTAVFVAGCGGGHKSAATHRRVFTETGHGRTMQFALAAASTGPVTAQVPSQPIGSTPSTIPGVTLQLYVLKRINPNAVLAVFALDIQSSVENAALPAKLIEPLDANWGSSGDVQSVSAVSLFDPTGLKEYLPYMANPKDDTTCMCSNVATAFGDAGVSYAAALLAAPASSVTSASFVTGLGTIANAPLG